MLQPGQEFAGFQIGRLLGTGGMGEVYEARHLRLGRVDVLKLLRPEAADAAVQRRFVREAEYAARLQHPHVVTIYGAGEVEGRLYLHLQRIDGPNLRELLDQQGPLPPARAIALLAGIADALDAAHAIGLVHRDVKPTNILVTPPRGNRAEQAYLTDFGVSILLGRTSLTTAGVVIGTFGYVPPELLAGGHPDARSDIYSLGRVLEETLTGVRPGQSSGPDQPTVGQPPAPRPDVALQQVVDRACAPNPVERFASCGDVIEAARQATTLRSEASPAAPAAPAARPFAAEAHDPDRPTRPPPGEASARAAVGSRPSADGPSADRPSADRPNADRPSADPSESASSSPPEEDPSSDRRRPRKSPWWLVAAGTLVLLVAGVVIFFLTHGTSSAQAGELFAEPANSTGAAPFTPNVAAPLPAPSLPPAGVPLQSQPTASNGRTVVQAVNGAAPGLYGGTGDQSSCDSSQMARFLAADPAKSQAWVSALNSDATLRWSGGTSLTVSQIPRYLSELTPVRLLADTRVTNNGYANGRPTPHQSVLQAGTAVLVDAYGVPRARCACGNPLAPPVALTSAPKPVGALWPGFGTTVVVQQSTTVIKNFTLVNIYNGSTYTQPAGTGTTTTLPSPVPTPPTATPSSSPPSSVADCGTVSFSTSPGSATNITASGTDCTVARNVAAGAGGPNNGAGGPNNGAAYTANGFTCPAGVATGTVNGIATGYRYVCTNGSATVEFDFVLGGEPPTGQPPPTTAVQIDPAQLIAALPHPSLAICGGNYHVTLDGVVGRDTPNPLTVATTTCAQATASSPTEVATYVVTPTAVSQRDILLSGADALLAASVNVASADSVTLNLAGYAASDRDCCPSRHFSQTYTFVGGQAHAGPRIPRGPP